MWHRFFVGRLVTLWCHSWRHFARSEWNWWRDTQRRPWWSDPSWHILPTAWRPDRVVHTNTHNFGMAAVADGFTADDVESSYPAATANVLCCSRCTCRTSPTACCKQVKQTRHRWPSGRRDGQLRRVSCPRSNRSTGQTRRRSKRSSLRPVRWETSLPATGQRQPLLLMMTITTNKQMNESKRATASQHFSDPFFITDRSVVYVRAQGSPSIELQWYRITATMKTSQQTNQ